MSENNSLTKVSEKIREIAEKSATDDYIYRGEPQCYDDVSSSLYRKYRKIEAKPFEIEVVQAEILETAKDFIRETDDLEILTQLQHYGYPTNLIDFTTDLNVALFFACDGHVYKDGQIILLQKTNRHVVTPPPQRPVNRVIAQKSTFVRPPEGIIQPNKTVVIPSCLKNPLLDHLRKYHDITTKTIYNDLHGFIKYAKVHQSANAKNYIGFVANNDQEAIERYTQAIKLNPQMFRAYNNRGNAYRRKGDNDRAIADYDKAIELNPDYTRAYNNRGNAYRRKGDNDRAIADYDKAIELNPDYTRAYNNRGNAYRRKGDNDRAIADYDKAIELNPDYTRSPITTAAMLTAEKATMTVPSPTTTRR